MFLVPLWECSRCGASSAPLNRFGSAGKCDSALCLYSVLLLVLPGLCHVLSLAQVGFFRVPLTNKCLAACSFDLSERQLQCSSMFGEPVPACKSRACFLGAATLLQLITPRLNLLKHNELGCY